MDRRSDSVSQPKTRRGAAEQESSPRGDVLSRRSSLKLTALGIAIGIVASGLAIGFAPRVPAPKMNELPTGLAGSVLVEDEGAMVELLFQYTAAQEPLVDATYTDFLRALDPSTRLVAVVTKAGDATTTDAQALRAFLGRIDRSGALEKRTRIVETEGPITVWSKDRALVLSAPRTQLVVPVRPDPRWRERYNDWATLAAVAREMPDAYLVNEVPLEYDAGDFAVTGDKIIVDVNLLTKNQKRGLTTAQALSEFLAKTFHRSIIFLGDKDGDVPRHHLSMYMTPIGHDAVLVGDPRAGRALVGEKWAPGEESPDTGEPLVADFSEASLARFDRAAKDLAAAGFRVERIPVVPFDDKTYVTYTNGVYESRAGRKIAYVPQYAVPKMDTVALETYVRLGWDVRPIRVREAYRFHGTIGCLCNVLRRSDG